MPEPIFEGPHRLTPYWPEGADAAALNALAAEVLRRGFLLVGQIRPQSLMALAPLLRAMNSYYTNRIEGQHTLPAELERALRQQWDERPEVARKQRLAITHMQAEAQIEAQAQRTRWPALFEPAVLRDMHRALFAALPAADLDLDDGSRLVPGDWRTANLTVGQHLAPAADSLPAYLAAWSANYGGAARGEAALIAVACAHHRLAWIHPFRDGNGRVARLHSHALLNRLEVTAGVWSVLRGLARRHTDYYARLADADSPRRGDYDGRGDLSAQALADWVRFFLEVCLDQIDFMTDLLALAGMKERIRALVAFESQRTGSAFKPGAAVALAHLFVVGELERGEFKQLTGLAARTAERLLKECLDRGLLVSATPRGALRLGAPHWALRWLYPRLWSEAEFDG